MVSSSTVTSVMVGSAACHAKIPGLCRWVLLAKAGLVLIVDAVISRHEALFRPLVATVWLGRTNWQSSCVTYHASTKKRVPAGWLATSVVGTWSRPRTVVSPVLFP